MPVSIHVLRGKGNIGDQEVEVQGHIRREMDLRPGDPGNFSSLE